jgi:hypothetical protein
MSDHKIAYFLVEGGRALELAKQYLADIERVRNEVREMSLELGITHGVTSRLDGTLMAADFPGEVHPDFKKPDRNGHSYPKKGTAWHARLENQKGWANPVKLITEEYGIPLSIPYKSPDGEGWTSIGIPLKECGFLYPCPEGPFAIYAPDVPAYVEEMKAEGKTIKEEKVRDFEFDIPGTRRITREEWDLVVAEFKVAKQRRELEAKKRKEPAVAV